MHRIVRGLVLRDAARSNHDSYPHTPCRIHDSTFQGSPPHRLRIQNPASAAGSSSRTKLPMDPSTPTERPRKRRAIKACLACRKAKVRCIGQRPCERCTRNDADCQYFDLAEHANFSRVERLEAELSALKASLGAVERNHVGRIEPLPAPLSTPSTASGPPDPVGGTSPAQMFGYGSSLPALANGMLASQTLVPPSTAASAVEKGLINWEQAAFWFQRCAAEPPYESPPGH